MASSESDPASRRVPSLVSYCQRVLSTHADAITFLGDDIRYDVIKPVLECCSADTLLRLEQSSPHLEQDTSDLWERLCFKTYPLLAEQFTPNSDESWRDQYFLLRRAEADRLEEVASRLRNQRLEAAERKKEREVKLTDKLPPTKRARSSWGTSSQPKTLFQKTVTEATKLRRSLYQPRLIQKTPYAQVHRSATANPPAVPSGKPATVAQPSAPIMKGTPHTIRSMSLSDPLSSNCLVTSPHLPSPPKLKLEPTDPRPTKPPIQKRDPMASLFMPKHRAVSQVSSPAGKSDRTVPAR